MNHILVDREGHLPDTPGNRQKLENLANDENAKLGGDKYGNEWYATQTADGQLWVQVRDGKITNGGINKEAKVYNSNTGLSAEKAPNSKE